MNGQISSWVKIIRWNILYSMVIDYSEIHLTERFQYCADFLITGVAPLRKCTPPAPRKIRIISLVYACLVPPMQFLAPMYYGFCLKDTSAYKIEHYGIN